MFESGQQVGFDCDGLSCRQILVLKSPTTESRGSDYNRRNFLSNNLVSVKKIKTSSKCSNNCKTGTP